MLTGYDVKHCSSAGEISHCGPNRLSTDRLVPYCHPGELRVSEKCLTVPAVEGVQLWTPQLINQITNCQNHRDPSVRNGPPFLQGAGRGSGARKGHTLGRALVEMVNLKTHSLTEEEFN